MLLIRLIIRWGEVRPLILICRSRFQQLIKTKISVTLWHWISRYWEKSPQRRAPYWFTVNLQRGYHKNNICMQLYNALKISGKLQYIRLLFAWLLPLLHIIAFTSKIKQKNKKTKKRATWPWQKLIIRLCNHIFYFNDEICDWNNILDRLPKPAECSFNLS